MKNLQTIQKAYHIFEILLKIAMIAAFVWAGLAFLGLFCQILLYYDVWPFGFDMKIIMDTVGIKSINEIIGSLLSSFIFAITYGILSIFAVNYVKSEQIDGTPFTENGAKQIRRLGIQTIIMPIVAEIITAVIHEIFDVTFRTDWGGSEIIVGFLLIFASFVFCYGAELEEAKKQ